MVDPNLAPHMMLCLAENQSCPREVRLHYREILLEKIPSLPPDQQIDYTRRLTHVQAELHIEETRLEVEHLAKAVLDIENLAARLTSLESAVETIREYFPLLAELRLAKVFKDKPFADPDSTQEVPVLPVVIPNLESGVA